MALLYAANRASIQQARSTSPIPERHCRLQIETLDFSQAEINGKLVVDNLCTETLPIAGIFVRIEINEIVRLETRVGTKVRSENLLAKEPWATLYVLGEDSNVCKLTIPPRKSDYLFTFNLRDSTMKQFPASFKSTNGSISYQVAAYIQRPYPDDKVYYQKLISTPPIRHSGYFNLSKDPTSTNLIATEKSIQKSFFSKRCSFKATLQVNKTGFLPGEEIPFSVTLNNISGESVSKALLSVVRRIAWKASSKEFKNTLCVLDTKTNVEPGREPDEIWSDVLRIPYSVHPTADGIVEFMYFLRLEIVLSERVPVKSETKILMGTTWGNAKTDDAVRKKLSSRQGSVESPVSSGSIPPNYSTLSSRKPSVETLPPGYEDAMGGVENLELSTLPEDGFEDEDEDGGEEEDEEPEQS